MDPAMNDTSILRSQDLVKIYGKRTVVSEVSLRVQQGEIV